MAFFSAEDDAPRRGRRGLGFGRGRRRRYRGGRGLTLADLDNHENFRVTHVDATGEIRRRLMDMGFVRGATGKLLREALLKDPIEVELMGYRVSLRRAEARDIFVEEIG